jgi:dephospho-CoA kinase
MRLGDAPSSAADVRCEDEGLAEKERGAGSPRRILHLLPLLGARGNLQYDSVVYVRSNPETRKVRCMSCGEFCPQTLKAEAAAKKKQMQNGNSKDMPSLTGEVVLDLSAQPSVGSK